MQVAVAKMKATTTAWHSTGWSKNWHPFFCTP